MNKLRNLYKGFHENIIKGGQTTTQAPPKYDFKGQKYQQKNRSQGPGITKEQLAQSQQLDEELKPQTRELRLKNAFYFTLYTGWFVGIILFIMYRLGSDEIGEMEKIAQERIRLREQLKREREGR